jgi:hypothetical protein
MSALPSNNRAPKSRRSPRASLPGASIYPLHRALLAQLGGLIPSLLLARLLLQTASDPTQPLLLLALLQGALAAIIARLQSAPSWWIGIHLCFLPLAIIATGWQLAPGWYLAGFLLLLAIFWRTDRSRVPLYLSNRTTGVALLGLIPGAPSRFIDLGCGSGGLIRQLALARPDCQFVGIEHAPLPWLIARMITAHLPNVEIRRNDFWQESLRDYTVIYAFLSPAPMARLREKAWNEMPGHAILISNSFDIPDVTPTQIVTVGDSRATRLLIYRRPIR